MNCAKPVIMSMLAVIVMMSLITDSDKKQIDSLQKANESLTLKAIESANKERDAAKAALEEAKKKCP